MQSGNAGANTPNGGMSPAPSRRRHAAMWGRRIIAVAAACLAIGLGDGAKAQDAQAGLPAALEALQAGDGRTALALTNRVIAQNPRNIDALLLKSRILFLYGQAREARDVARAAFEASGDLAPARYASALRLAELNAADGNYPLSQFWIRRALPYARSDAEVQQLSQAYQTVKDRNPWRFGFSAGVAPNSNINNGSSEDLIYLYGLPFVLSPTAQALSGYTGQADATLRYRVSQTDRSQTWIGLEGAGKVNWLDRTSRAAAPGARGSDYNFYSLGITATHIQLVGEGTRLEFTGRAGRNWYGGSKLSDFFGAGASATVPIAEGRDALTLSARADRALLVQGGLSPETTLRAAATYAHQLSWGDRVSAELSYAKTFSANAPQVYGLPRVELEYDFGRPIMGAHFEIGASYGYKDYSVSPYTASGRQDHILAGHVSAEFRNFSVLGFAPIVTVEGKRVWSNVPLYSQTSLSGGISFESRF